MTFLDQLQLVLNRSQQQTPVWGWFDNRVHLHPRKLPINLLANSWERNNLTTIIEKNLIADRRKLLYIHIPFCFPICHYCPFYRNIPTDNIVHEFVLSLKEALGLLSTKLVSGRGFDSVYFGGGTPTYLSFKQLLEIIEIVVSSFPINSNSEISVESRLTGIDREYLKELSLAGVNRISFGVQSFQRHLRKRLTRMASTKDIEKIITIAAELGFKTINIDLMYGIPNQSTLDWERDLLQLFLLPVTAASTYRLNLHDSTKMADRVRHGKISLPNDKSIEYAQFIHADELFSQNGWVRYTTSNYGHPDYEKGIYNKYQSDTKVDLVGIGPSAKGQIGNIFYLFPPDTTSFIRNKDLVVQSYRMSPQYLNDKNILDISLHESLYKCNIPNYDLLKHSLDIMSLIGLIAEEGDSFRLSGPEGRYWNRTIFDGIQSIIESVHFFKCKAD